MENWRKWLGRGVWLFLLAVLLYWAIRNAPLADIWTSLRQLTSWQLAVLAIINSVIVALITLRWWLVVHAENGAVPFPPLIAYRLSAFGLSYFTPGPQVGGEPLQIIYLQRRYGISYARATSAVFMDKLLEFLANFLFLAFGLFAVFRAGLISENGIQIGGGLVFIALLFLWPPIHIFLLYHGYYPVSGIFRALQDRFGKSDWMRLLIVAERMAGGFTRRHLGTLLLALGVSLLAWVVMVAEYALMLDFLHIPLDFWQMIASLTAVRLAFLMPLPAGLGALEAAQVFALSAFGFPAAAGMSLSLVMRGRDILLGGLGLLLAGREVVPMKARTLFFVSPRQVELCETSLQAPAPGQVLVETLFSAISPGTEMLVYRGQFPKMALDASIESLSGQFGYPLAYGYACVGRVVELGAQVDLSWRGKLVFAFQPHTSHFVVAPVSLFPLPPEVTPETACFLPNMETAVNLVQDGAPLLGERVLVFGQGIIGLLTTTLLSEFPLEGLVTVDRFSCRCDASRTLGVSAALNPDARDFRQQAQAILMSGADLTFELSGAPAALNDAIALTTFSGRIVIGSWYGEKRAALDLGGAFHRSRIKLISSQVSTIAPELSGRWDKARRFDVAWNALKRLRPEKWITHRFPLRDAAKAYQLLDENPQEAIQVLLKYD